ncbi:MAG: hypothetical protein RBU21_23810 [FCB group bacterium]|jgi:ubiquinone/menaquinone biosynthesis C-methylase UbiE|nr:hypothetical protein [FCB group bacterium]
MSLMDIPEPERSISEAFRVLKPGGFLQFSITHPCFNTPYRRNLRDGSGQTYAIEVGQYFRNLNGEISEWMFTAVPAELRTDLPKFKVPRLTRTFGQWINSLSGVGFRIECVEEPYPSDEDVQRCPHLQDAQVAA